LAQDDLQAIQAYTLVEWGVDQWRIYEENLHRALEILSDNSRIGRARADLPTGYRAFPIEQHIIVYRITTRAVSVSRILHRRMDIAQAFRRR
jgi:toxin ParE1/3/4